LYNEFITKEALEWFGDFKLGGQVIRTVKYVVDPVLVAKEVTVDRLRLEDATEWKRMWKN
jgi:hypothetical protein